MAIPPFVAGVALTAAELNAGFVPTAWTAVTFTNSWVNFDGSHPAQYRMVGDEVQLRGTIKSGTIGLAAFTLPVGFRPIQEATFAVASNGALGYVTINATGTPGSVVPATPSSNVYVYLSGIRFSTVS